jgi:hypothetical protein
MVLHPARDRPDRDLLSCLTHGHSLAVRYLLSQPPTPANLAGPSVLNMNTITEAIKACSAKIFRNESVVSYSPATRPAVYDLEGGGVRGRPGISPSSASARAASLLPRFPHGKAQHRRSRGSVKPDTHPCSSHEAPGYPAGYPLADHDYQPWRMRTGAPRT